MPRNPRPVVETLERQMDVFVGFQFDAGQAAVMRGGQHVDHGPVGGGECGNLRIEQARIQALVDDADIGHHERFQPAFGTQAEQGMLAGTVGWRVSRTAVRIAGKTASYGHQERALRLVQGLHLFVPRACSALVRERIAHLNRTAGGSPGQCG
ncbi:MAG: hypothetical protein WA830_05265 [Candidatus Sulfotelmatobacter sp.]